MNKQKYVVYQINNDKPILNSDGSPVRRKPILNSDGTAVKRKPVAGIRKIKPNQIKKEGVKKSKD